MNPLRIAQIVAGLAGLLALTLGLLIWIAQLDAVRNVHMLFGFIVALILLALGILALSTRGMRVLGVAGIIYALILPLFGLTQEMLLVGNAHWLIQTAHMLVGLGGLALMGIISTRYMRLKRPIAAPQVTVSPTRR